MNLKGILIFGGIVGVPLIIGFLLARFVSLWPAALLTVAAAAASLWFWFDAERLRVAQRNGAEIGWDALGAAVLSTVSAVVAGTLLLGTIIGALVRRRNLRKRL